MSTGEASRHGLHAVRVKGALHLVELEDKAGEASRHGPLANRVEGALHLVEHEDKASPQQKQADPENKNKIRSKNKTKSIVKKQTKISEAFKKIVEKNSEDLPDKNSIRKMWQELDKNAEILLKPENKKKELEKLKANKTLKINENENKNKNETKQQQQQQTIDNKQKQNNEAGKTITTTNLKKKTIETKTNPEPSMNKTTKPKLNSTSKLKVQGKQISDIDMLRDFLTRKKLERAERGIAKNIASHTHNSQSALQRDQPTADTGDTEPEKQGLEFAAKGNPVLDVTPSIGQNKLKRCDWANKRQR